MKKNLKWISTILAFIILQSCGKNDSDKSNQPSVPQEENRNREVAAVDGSNIQGHYQAQFMTLNPHVNGTIPGSANFFRKENNIFAYVRLFAGGVKAWHMQNVYTGSRCPNLSDDKNGDGFIDILEAEQAVGKILIPLDSDISSQNSGRRFYPLADASGSYQYERMTSINSMLRDLQGEDKDPADDFVKLAANEGMSFEGKVVLIQGVSENVVLPESVGSKTRLAAFQTLPIACGIFKKITGEPGVAHSEGDFTGPIGEVVDGQDRPSEEPTSDNGGDTTGTTLVRGQAQKRQMNQTMAGGLFPTVKATLLRRIGKALT